MAANSLFIGVCDQEPFRLPGMQDQISLMLCWRSFSWWGRERVAFSFAYKRYQYFHYVYSLPSRVFITRLTGPKIVDTHFQDGASSVLHSLFPIKDAKTSIMYIHYQITFLLPDLQHQTSLMLHWCSFCHGHIHNIPSFHLAEYIIKNILTAFLSSSGTIFFITSLFLNNTYK